MLHCDMNESFQSLQDWLSWQAQLNPKEIDLGLSRVQSVLKNMKLPNQHQPVIITVGGTNGKGSTVAMLASIYEAAGYTTGCYTSPHFIQYNERITLNGVMVTDEQIIQAFQVIEQARGRLLLTYFEFATLAAWYCFIQAQVDVAILEVGLGGRLDAVNVFQSDPY